jgi:hypothetical protein
MLNKLPPYNYTNLRTVIHNILYDFFDREFECGKGGEFDFEWMEHSTDEILRLIQRQEGKTSVDSNNSIESFDDKLHNLPEF